MPDDLDHDSSLRWRQSDPGILTVELFGELDSHSTPPLLERIDEQVSRSRLTHLVVDLSGVTFFGSAGVEVLLRLQNDPRRRFDLHLAGVHDNRPVRRVLDALGLTDHFDVRSDHAEPAALLADDPEQVP